MGLFEELRAAGNLVEDWNLQRGGLVSSMGGVLTLSGSTNNWGRRRGRLGMGNVSVGAGYLVIGAGNPANLQLSTMSLMLACSRESSAPADHNCLIAKAGVLLLGYFLSAEPRTLSIYDYGGAATRASSFSEGVTNIPHSIVVNLVSGVASGSEFFVDGVSKGKFTWTVSTQVNPWQVTRGSGAGSGMGGSIYRLSFANRTLTNTEVARLYDEWMMSGSSPDLPRRNFVQVPRGLTDAEYASKSIVLDTAFETGLVGGVRKVLDMGPNNYSGTIVGVMTPGQDGIGLQYPSAASNIYFGDVTQLNSAVAFTMEHEVAWPAGNIVSNYLLHKFTDGNNNIDIEPFGALATTKKLYFAVCNAGVAYGTTNATVFRAGCVQHYMTVFNGLGADNTAKSQVYVDGELYTQTYVGNLPAATANLATKVLYAGFTGAASAVVQHNKLRTNSVALTAAQARARYVEFARRVLLHETFEDVPVSLAAVSAGNMLGQWRVISGTWRCSETSDGKRWLECVTAGSAAMPQKGYLGTFDFTLLSAAGNTFVMYNATKPLARNAATQDGYYLLINVSGRIVPIGVLNGVDVSSWFWTAVGGAEFGKAYRFAISRRPSDGRVTVWAKGNAYTTWTLLSNAGGAGVNPSAAETTSFTGGWTVLTFAAGDKLCLYDPRDPMIGFTHFQGQLDPTQGELA